MDSTASVDSSLWWDSFADLLRDLESTPVSSELPQVLADKLRNSHDWLWKLVSLFKPQNEKSKVALSSQRIQIGSSQLLVRPELRDSALKISRYLLLDEVQSYILVNRLVEQHAVEYKILSEEFLYEALLRYYTERQCLLKCTRQLFVHALSCFEAGIWEGSVIRDEIIGLISDGLEDELLSVFQDILSCRHLDNMEADLFLFLVEEALIEGKLILDIVFLCYYESFCNCSLRTWKKLCRLYKEILCGSMGKLAVSLEASQRIRAIKFHVMLILIETLDLDSLLQMVHDQTDFSPSIFPMGDMKEINSIISDFSTVDTEDAAPLVLAWAVFLCLTSSLHGAGENSSILEIDQASYVRQAFESSPFSYFLEILQNDQWIFSDGPSTGYRSIVRTFISGFIASYDLNLQPEDKTARMILDILRLIYRGEESMCSQFWDRSCFVDGPIRSLLFSLENEFPFRILEFVRLLSALSEGCWPSHCVYNFLEKSVGLSSLFAVSSDSFVDDFTRVVVTESPLHVPGIEGLVIPGGTSGRILRIFDGNCALVRWQCNVSGVLVLLFWVAQEHYVSKFDEVFAALDLLCRLVSFNKALCFALGSIGGTIPVQRTSSKDMVKVNIRVDVTEMLTTLVKNLFTASSSNASLISLGVMILANLLKCWPSHVTTVATKKNLFELMPDCTDVVLDISCKGFVSGVLANLLLVDTAQNDNCWPLIVSVLEFAVQLIESGAQDSFTVALVLFCIQYVFLNHDLWTYKRKQVRWEIKLEVLKLIKNCILLASYSWKQWDIVRSILLKDSSIHNALFQVLCIRTQCLENMSANRVYETADIDVLHHSICSVLDIIHSILSLEVDLSYNLPTFHEALLSSSTKSIPVVSAILSMISWFNYPDIQVSAAKVLSALFLVSFYSKDSTIGVSCFLVDYKQMEKCRRTVGMIFHGCSSSNEDLFLALCGLLTSAACYKPCFLVNLIAVEGCMDVDAYYKKGLNSDTSFCLSEFKESTFLGALIQSIGRSSELIRRDPRKLLNVLGFLKALWRETTQFADIIKLFKNSGKIWEGLYNALTSIEKRKNSASSDVFDMDFLNAAYVYSCQAVALEILACDIFFLKRLQNTDFCVDQFSGSWQWCKDASDGSIGQTPGNLRMFLSTWLHGSALRDLTMSLTTCIYECNIYSETKVTGALLILNMLGKVATGDTGNLSMLLVEKLHVMFGQLCDLPAFTELVAQYSRRGYGKGEQLQALILNDLYYHVEGELHGREVQAGPFKVLSVYLLESKFFEAFRRKYAGDVLTSGDVHLFNIDGIESKLQLNMWEHSSWKKFTPIAQKFLQCLRRTNAMVMISTSKLSALKSLITVISLFRDDGIPESASQANISSDKSFIPCISHISSSFLQTVESISATSGLPKDVLDFFSAQAELVFSLVEILGDLPLTTCITLVKMAGGGLKVLSDLFPLYSGIQASIKFLLLSLLHAVKSWNVKSRAPDVVEVRSENFSEISNMSLGLLPALCKFAEVKETCALTLTVIDSLLRSFYIANTWVPIIQKHLQMKHLVSLLCEKSFAVSVEILLKCLLSLARASIVAEMLLDAEIFPSLKALFDCLLEKESLPLTEKVHPVWGLGLSVIIAMIHSLSDRCDFLADCVIPYFFFDKKHVLIHYLSTPECLSVIHAKKGARIEGPDTFFSALEATQYTLLLLCEVAKHHDLWTKVMKWTDSQLEETCIHYLAFISHGNLLHVADSLHHAAAVKDEFDNSPKMPYFSGKHGWLAFSPMGRILSSSRTKSTDIVLKSKMPGSSNIGAPTYFSDDAAFQIYKNAFLLLRLLCFHVEGASKRVTEVGFVHSTHFPKLPTPDILHGLQDLAIAILTGFFDGNVEPISETLDICMLFIQILEMALYLELCLRYVYSILPVLRRIDNFTNGFKSLLKVMEGHDFLNGEIRSLQHVSSLLYPEQFSITML